MADFQAGGLTQGLVDHAITLGQAQQRRHLFFARPRIIASRSSTPNAVATAPNVTPAHATSASSNISPEHALRPLPPVAGCNPASTSALPVSPLQVTFPPNRPLARSVTSAVSGFSRYCSLSGACNDFNSVASM